MKNFLKRILSIVFWLVILFIAVGYYINYRVDGELSFTPNDTVVYTTPDLSKASYSLHAGEKFTSLTNFSDNDSVKIRFMNSKSGKEEIGFIKSSDCFIYDFDLNSLTGSDSFIMSVDSSVSFQVFLEEFSHNLLNRKILGIYLEDSDYSENDFLRIRSFCEDLKIPYGFISDFSTTSVKKYIDQKNVDQDTVFQPSCILPQVFDVSAVMNGYQFRDELSDCIFKAASARDDNFKRYWITSDSSKGFADIGVLMITSEEDIGFEYSIVSPEFKDEITDTYNNSLSNL